MLQSAATAREELLPSAASARQSMFSFTTASVPQHDQEFISWFTNNTLDSMAGERTAVPNICSPGCHNHNASKRLRDDDVDLGSNSQERKYYVLKTCFCYFACSTNFRTSLIPEAGDFVEMVGALSGAMSSLLESIQDLKGVFTSRIDKLILALSTHNEYSEGLNVTISSQIDKLVSRSKSLQQVQAPGQRRPGRDDYSSTVEGLLLAYGSSRVVQILQHISDSA